jgi:hypothetical protein
VEKNMSEKWIQKMHLKKGALTSTAAKHDGIKSGGGIKNTFLHEAASGKYGALTKKRAVLALSFKKMHH